MRRSLYFVSGLSRAIARAVMILSGLFGALSALGILLLMLLTVTDMASRNLQNTGVPGAVDAASVLLVFIVFLGLPIGEQRKTHVRTALLTDRLPAGTAAAVRILSGGCTTCITGYMAWETRGAAIRSFQIREYVLGLVNVPVWPAKVVIPVGLLVLSLVSLIGVCASLANFVDIRKCSPDGVEGGGPRPETMKDASRHQGYVEEME